MKRRLYILLLLITCSLLGLELSAQWRADSISGYSQRTLQMRDDYVGAVTATLIRHDRTTPSKRALLYVHGYNDYFFQAAMGDSIAQHGIDFYALDLRKYGRSILPHQDAFEVRDLREYYEELGAALKIIREEGAEEVYLMAHSTGGLITSLYLADTKNQDSIRAFILNSPFFDFNFSKAEEKIVLPLLTASAGIAPSKVISGVSKSPDLYAQSLLSRYHGPWDYDTHLKKDYGHPIRLGWLRAIRRGHKRVQRGLQLPMPILLMSSDKSIRAKGAWQEAFGKADLVLDVKDIQRYGRSLALKSRHTASPTASTTFSSRVTPPLTPRSTARSSHSSTHFTPHHIHSLMPDLDSFDIRDQSTLSTEEQDIDRALRPLSFDTFRGQDKAVENLKIFVQAAKMRSDALDHVLLYGPPGLGKTTLSHIIAAELGVGIKITSGPVLDKPGDLAGLLTSLEPNDVLFIDEIHRLSPIVEEYLYSAMEDYRIDIMLDKGPSARSIQIDLNPFTLVGATTRSGLLTAPLRARFGINLHLEYYDIETLADIVHRSADILQTPCVPSAAVEVASRSRGTPRIANALLRRVRDFAQVKGDGRITKEIACYALEALNIDRYGLDYIDNKLLGVIIDKFAGGPVGLTTIATALGEDPGTVEEVYEPYLIKEGFIKRTPRGREATDLAYSHLGRKPRIRQAGSFFDDDNY